MPDVGDGRVGLGRGTSLDAMFSTLCIGERGLGFEDFHHLRLRHLPDDVKVCGTTHCTVCLLDTKPAESKKAK